MKQTIEIEVPDGKRAIWKDNKVVFEDIKPKLPETWEEYCQNNKIRKNEFYIDSFSDIIELTRVGCNRNSLGDKNLLPSQKAAEAHLALIQLHQLRDCYRQGWVPNWKDNYNKYVIVKQRGIYGVYVSSWAGRFLSFQDEKRAEEFLTNFRELIEKAGDLV